MRVDVALPIAVVVDVLRATSAVAQALASGYRRILCCAEIDEALSLGRAQPGALIAGERGAVRVEGFDVGASPRELLEARAETLILSTTNGTRAILAAAAACDEVLLGSLLNLGAVAAAVQGRRRDVTIVCAGFEGRFALDDAFCAGRIVSLLGGDRTDSSLAAELVARSFDAALDGLNARTYGPPGLEEDIRWCARESVLDVVPCLTRMVGPAAEFRAADTGAAEGSR